MGVQVGDIGFVESHDSSPTKSAPEREKRPLYTRLRLRSTCCTASMGVLRKAVTCARWARVKRPVPARFPSRPRSIAEMLVTDGLVGLVGSLQSFFGDCSMQPPRTSDARL